MRRLKHKHTRRAVQFYEINYGFRKPFKVILDGNFVHALRETHMGDPAEILAKLLGGPVKLYVTRCSLLELQGLGSDFSATYGAAKRAGMHLSCGHDDAALTTTDCILDNVGKDNPQHYFVATQDKALRVALGNLPGGASVFVNVNGVQLEQPSETQKRAVKEVDDSNMRVQKHELSQQALAELAELQKGPREKSIFKRKKSSGPNPLSVKKKKKRPAPVQPSTQQGDAEKPKRKRVRKRSKAESGQNGEQG
ncbi:rRNA-processing protein UTP23 homolog [Coccomyxa sp. Obi]|nr:rRNA-processing protein UTP23 homolog [Coccomyxa sp. Obi]